MSKPTSQGEMHVSQSQKYRRVIDADTGDVVQLAMTDTGLTTADGLKIYAVGTSSMPGTVSDGPNAVTSNVLTMTGGTDSLPVTTDARFVWLQNEPSNANDVLVFGYMNLGPGEQMVIPTGNDASWITVEGTLNEYLNYAILRRS